MLWCRDAEWEGGRPSWPGHAMTMEEPLSRVAGCKEATSTRPSAPRSACPRDVRREAAFRGPRGRPGVGDRRHPCRDLRSTGDAELGQDVLHVCADGLG